MIPRTIHYCWFGSGQMPEKELECIRSWRRFMPDYEIKEWNESNFDISKSPLYVRQAHQAGKYAFVSDYVRLFALHSEGGIYLDTDVELLKSLDAFRDLDAFAGFEQRRSLPLATCVLASRAGGLWVREQLDSYNGRTFIREDGSLDLTTNVDFISATMSSHGFIQNGERQRYLDLEIFPVEYFSPMSSTRVLNITPMTYCIHHFAGSWKEKTRYDAFKEFITGKVLGYKLTDRLVRLKRLVLK